MTDHREVLRVTLEPAERKEAIAIGHARYQSQRDAGRPDGRVHVQQGPYVDVWGALAEKAVAVALQLKWDGAFREIPQWLMDRDGDVGGGLEVKSTVRPDGSLLLRPHNGTEYRLGGSAAEAVVRNAYVLVITPRETYPAMFLVGWKFADEARQQVFWDANMPRPCYRIAQAHLRSVRSLARHFPRDRKRTQWVTAMQRDETEASA